MVARNKFRLAAFGIVAVAAIAVIFPFNKKKAVQSHLSKTERYIQEKNIEKLMPLFSLYYKDDIGMTYGSLGGSFDYVFKQYQDITVTFIVDSISCGKDTCVAHIALWAHAKWPVGRQDLVGKENEFEPLDVYCIREFLKWKIIGSHWPKRKPGIPDFY